MAREIGRYDSGQPGPLLICVGGMHGNEPAGIEAIRAVVDKLHATRPAMRGMIVGLGGNLAALGRNERFVNRDLNRQWLTERVEHLRSRGPGDNPPAEDVEQWELLTAIDSLILARTGRPIFLDLHSTSGPGAPFAIIEDTLPNRRLAFNLPLPVILGLEEKVEGTFIDFINGLGHRGISVEGGQQGDPDTVLHHQAVIWLTMESAGLIRSSDAEPIKRARQHLQRVGKPFPRVLETRHRHGVGDGDCFVMRPGYSNFSKVEPDEHVADDRRGAIRAPERGRLLLPLYQEQGNDGFFLVRVVPRFWLFVAALLRHLRAGRWLRYLPGLYQPPGIPDTLIVERRVVRYYPNDLFTLLGYRRQRQHETRLVLQRRKQHL